jgi:hypothetical protein
VGKDDHDAVELTEVNCGAYHIVNGERHGRHMDWAGGRGVDVYRNTKALNYRAQTTTGIHGIVIVTSPQV